MTTKKILTNPENILTNVREFIENNQLELATNTLEQACKSFPKEPSFFNLLAQLSLQNKKLDNGISLLKQSLHINPKQPLVIFDLGIALSLNNELDEAVIFFDQSIELEPKDLKVYIRKAMTLRKSNRLKESIDCYQKIIALKPDYIDAYINKAELLYMIGNLEESLSTYEEIFKIDSSNAILFIRYGNLLSKLGRVDEAISSYRKSIEIEPENSGAYSNLGSIYQKLGDHEEEIKCLRKSIEINEDYEVCINLATSYSKIKEYKLAIKFYDRAINLDSSKTDAFIQKAYFYQSIKEIDNAILLFSKALEIDKNYKYLFGERFYAKNSICDWSNFDEDSNFIKLRLSQRSRIAHPLGVCNNFDGPLIQKEAAKIWADDKFPYDDSLGVIKKYTKNKKIKIGYFSGDFSEHPVGFLIADLLEKHDKSKFELFGFSVTKKIASETRLKIKKSFDEFIDVENCSDKDVALLAREKKIDIAIDLGGYTKSGRPGIFAMRAAPIQITYLGYVGTSGTNYFDYIFSDKFITRKESQQYYTEKIIYLPKCYQPTGDKIPLSEKNFTRKSQGLPDTGFVFCCFNSSWKITPTIFKLWIRLLSNIPRSVLWFPGFSALAINNLRNECKKLGMNQERLIFSSIEKYRQDHYKRIELADLFLDCYPYGGHSTVSDFLRAGVPVITLKGTSIPNMVASSLLFNLSLSELITSSELDYEKLAIKIATNPKFFKEIKSKLISNIENSSVYNTYEYIKSIESGYDQVYDRYHNSFTPDYIEAK